MPMPVPSKDEKRDDFISRFMSDELMKKEYSDKDQRLTVAYSQWKKDKKIKEALCLKGLKIKEETDNTYIVQGLVATTHPDRVGDILSKNSLVQIKDFINETSIAGGNEGAYRSVSLFHDWIHAGDPTLDEAGFLKPTAELVELEDGHYGVRVEAEINKYYKGDMSPEEISYRIQNGQIAGFSIEYNTDEEHTRDINHGNKTYRFIDELTDFGGVGFARARMIANPQAVIYKEIENQYLKTKEDDIMADEIKPEETPQAEEAAPEAPKEEVAPEAPKEESTEEPTVEEKEEPEVKEISVKEILESKEFKEKLQGALEDKKKVLKQTKEDVSKMEGEQTVSLSVKEMRTHLASGDTLKFKEAAQMYVKEHPEIEEQMRGLGVPLRQTLQTKTFNANPSGLFGMGKLRIVNNIQTKDTLDTTTNTTTYTQNIVEFADIYVPTIVDIFNSQTNLFGALPKKDNILGTDKYQWRNRTDQASSLAVDPDDTTIAKDPVDKIKLQTPMKVYRVGVSVTDYMQHFSRGSIGDLFQLEVEIRMRDLMRDINNDLFTEQADGDGKKVLGLEAVADSAGNTTLYGLTRSSTTNKLSPVTATDTYFVQAAAIGASTLRVLAKTNEVQGSLRGNLRYVMNPTQRDIVFNLEDSKIRYMNEPRFGFFGAPAWDGIPMIIDSSAQTDAIFCVDFEAEFIVIGKGPELVGLAKVGAAKEGYIEIYLAHVYENPLRISMVDGVPTS